MRIQMLPHPQSLTFKVIVSLLLLMIPFAVWAVHLPTPVSSQGVESPELPVLPEGFVYSQIGFSPFEEPPANAVAWGVINRELDQTDIDDIFDTTP